MNSERVKMSDSSFYKREESDSKLAHLDVEGLLSAGIEPYPVIMDYLQKLQVDEKLTLRIPFEPKPLILQLTRMGFQFSLQKEGLDSFRLTISRADVS